MELPDDLRSVVCDFARPCSRADWRTIHRMPEAQFHRAIEFTYNILNIPVIESFVKRYDQAGFIYVFQHWSYHPTLRITPNTGQPIARDIYLSYPPDIRYGR